jgi:integrase
VRQTKFGVQNAVDTLSENRMGKNLTEAAVKRARAPKAGQAFLWDAAVKGFGLRILPSGSKTFWFQYRPRGGGSSRMVRIRSFPDISVAKARKIASTYAGKVAEGGNPAADLHAERMRDKATLRVLLAEGGPYPRELERRGVVNIKPALSSLRRGLHGLMSREVSYLSRHDLRAAIDAVETDRGPGAADDLRKFSRVFLEWCVERGSIIANPLAGLRRPMRTRAERLKAASNGGRALSDDEIRKLWQAAGDKIFGSFGGLVRLALLTGLRRGELAQIERARDLLADRIVVRPEHAKTGAQHEVPLTPLMRQVIAGAPITTSKLLFPSPVTGGRLAGWTTWITNLRQASGVNFRLHDLRRTARTLMSQLHVPEDIAELAIGHVRKDLVARYNFDTAWAGRRDAFTRVSDHVASLIGARAGAAVIPLRST